MAKTPEEIAAEKAAKAAKEAEEKAAIEAAEKAAKEKEEAEKAAKAAKEAEEKALSGNYIMKVTRLDWGLNNKNHFYADKKPLINAKVMGKYASTLSIWLKNGWIEKGSYKK